MEIIKTLIKLFLHINIVCSLVLLAIQALDWYNPYMDFMGRAAWVMYTLYICTVLFGIFAAFLTAGAAHRKPAGRCRWV